jgi:hypothetical protein
MNSVQTTAQEDNKWARWAEDTGEKIWTNRKFCRGLLRQSCWLTGGHHGGRRLFGGSCHTPWAGVTDTPSSVSARGEDGAREVLGPHSFMNPVPVCAFCARSSNTYSIPAFSVARYRVPCPGLEGYVAGKIWPCLFAHSSPLLTKMAAAMVTSCCRNYAGTAASVNGYPNNSSLSGFYKV